MPLYSHPVFRCKQEWLFRCALLPAVGADWRGVTVAAAVFGALHVSGGRNTAFAAWASVVGLAYGALAVTLRDGSAPMLAHAAANAAGALLWRSQHPEALAEAAAVAAAGSVPQLPPQQQQQASSSAAWADPDNPADK